MRRLPYVEEPEEAQERKALAATDGKIARSLTPRHPKRQSVRRRKLKRRRHDGEPPI
ncbi:hypothetical protein [Rhodoblastus sp.]|uniref:hypothetical protein n=1 Tax=Rhodoblastus sp. TaxID=1962975 RepID=UPI002602FA8C|nr:hypothetical protein [Rhodoblastus sp.]